jgi:hypothetical protein
MDRGSVSGRGPAVEAPRWLIPPGAAAEWAALYEALAGVAPACRLEPDTWWEPGSVASAKAACQHCPALRECLAFAVAADERFGVWGGLSPEERRLRRGGSAVSYGC